MKVNPDVMQIQHDYKVRKLEEEQREELQKLSKLHKHQTQDQLESIERSKKNHEEVISRLRNDQEVQLQTQIDKNDEKLLGEIDRKQKILEENRNLILKDNTRLDNELEKTRKLYQDQLSNLKSDQDLIAKQKYDDFKQNAEKFNQISQDQMAIMKDKYELASAKEQNQKKIDFSTFVSDAEKISLDQRQKFQRQYDKNAFEQSDKLLAQEVEFQNRLGETSKGNKHVEDQNEKRHQYQLESTNQQYKNKLEQEKENFTNQKNVLVSTSQAELDTIKGAYAKELSKLRLDFSKEKESIENKASDPFYRITTLEPKVSELEKGYEVSMILPKHESENVVFTANARDLKLSVARNFSDEVTLDDGSKNLSRKSETFTKLFKVNDIVDPKQITRKYEDGVLSFFIKKA